MRGSGARLPGTPWHGVTTRMKTMNTVERLPPPWSWDIVVGAAAIVARKARCYWFPALGPAPTPTPALRPGCSDPVTSLGVQGGRPGHQTRLTTFGRPERDCRAHGSGRGEQS